MCTWCAQRWCWASLRTRGRRCGWATRWTTRTCGTSSRCNAACSRGTGPPASRTELQKKRPFVVLVDASAPWQPRPCKSLFLPWMWCLSDEWIGCWWFTCFHCNTVDHLGGTAHVTGICRENISGHNTASPWWWSTDSFIELKSGGNASISSYLKLCARLGCRSTLAAGSSRSTRVHSWRVNSWRSTTGSGPCRPHTDSLCTQTKIKVNQSVCMCV